jgi:ABC-type sulfate transport system permease component
MESTEPSLFFIIASVLGAYALLASLFLLIGSQIKRRYPTATTSGFSATVHIVALFGFLVGCLLAWMAYDSDHPMKERHLLLPLVFPIMVYGYIAFHWLKGFGFAAEFDVISSLFSNERH